MGTLGCINDMVKRDKENRELRKIGRDRLKETRKRLLNLDENSELPEIPLEEWESIALKIKAKEESERKYQLKIKQLFFIILISAALLISIIFLCI